MGFRDHYTFYAVNIVTPVQECRRRRRRSAMNYEQSENVLTKQFQDINSQKYANTRKINRRNEVMRTCSMLGLMIIAFGLSGCMIVDSPIKGILGTEVIWGDMATGKNVSDSSSKEGKACAQSILGLLARGDASVRKAKENGNITEVTSVDHSARNLLNIVGEWCTIVKGH